MFGVQALLLWTLVPLTAPNVESTLVPWTSPVWLVMTLVLTVLCTYTAYILMNAWQPRITSTEAGLIYCTEPIFGSLLALVLPALFSIAAEIDYLNETGTWSLLIGGGLITLANILLQLKPPPR